MRPQSLFWIRADNPLSTIVPTQIANLNNFLTLNVQPSGSLYSNIRQLSFINNSLDTNVSLVITGYGFESLGTVAGNVITPATTLPSPGINNINSNSNYISETLEIPFGGEATLSVNYYFNIKSIKCIEGTGEINGTLFKGGGGLGFISLDMYAIPASISSSLIISSISDEASASIFGTNGDLTIAEYPNGQINNLDIQQLTESAVTNANYAVSAPFSAIFAMLLSTDPEVDLGNVNMQLTVLQYGQ